MRDDAMTTSRFVEGRIDEISRTFEELGSGEAGDAARGRILGELVKHQARLPFGALLRLALYVDCLAVAELAIDADGVFSREEAEYAFHLARTAVKLLARMRSAYEEFADLTVDDTKDMLEAHRADKQEFGGAWAEKRWIGAAVCQRFVEEGKLKPLEIYREMMARIIAEIFDLNRDSASVESVRQKLVADLDTRTKLPPGPSNDFIREAFFSPKAPEVFHTIAHGRFWERDAFDVEEIHAPAREAFRKTVERMRADPRGGSRSLLVLGDSGSGKTHLARAFRASLHGKRLGYSMYTPIGHATSRFSKYLLTETVASLDQPYDPPDVQDSALLRLSNALATSALEEAEITALREDDIPPPDLARLIHGYADRIVNGGIDIDIDIARALLYFQRREPATRSRALKFLRCDYMGVNDREYLGDIAPPPDDDNGPMRHLEQLGRVIERTKGGVLAFFLDQLEDLQNAPKAASAQAFDLLRQIGERIPNAFVVVFCLRDFWDEATRGVTRAVLDRLVRDPEPVTLNHIRDRNEVESLVGRRLECFWDELSVQPADDLPPLYPFSDEFIAAQVGKRTRDVVDACRMFRDHETSPTVPVVSTPPAPDEPPAQFDVAWSANQRTQLEPLVDDEEILEILAEAIRAAASEVPPVEAHATVTGDSIRVVLSLKGAREELHVALCNRASQGGALQKQLQGLPRAPLYLLRSSEFPPSGQTKVARTLAELVKNGAMRDVLHLEDVELFRRYLDFMKKHRDDVGFMEWCRSAKVLTQQRHIERIYKRVEQLQPPPAPAPPPLQPSSPPPTSLDKPAPREDIDGGEARVLVGSSLSLSAEPVYRRLNDFTTHCAFLGATKSGKTTAALAVIESAATQNIPIILVDRKGDLCGYADSRLWESDERRKTFASFVDVSVFTPGTTRGRPLSIPLVPPKEGDIALSARYSAGALAKLLQWKSAGKGATKTAILMKCLEVLATLGGSSEGLASMITLLQSEDALLIDALNGIDTKIFPNIIEELQTIDSMRPELFSTKGEILDVGSLLTRGERAKITIISTKFLHDSNDLDFWVSQLLVSLTRHASKRPSKSLAGLVFFDEADIYLPAIGKPATKEPMMDLLRRARSAGLGVMLASQNPGDFDYKCRENIRTWFLGRITEANSVEKMKPLLTDAKVNVGKKLATAATGEFFLLADGEVTPIRGQLSLLRTEQLSEEEILALAGRR